MDILEYINENLPKCVAYTPDSDGELIGLPYPYIMPCAYTGFRAMFYWDTYFIHKGLLVRGDLTQIQNDIDNMRYLIRQYGFVPNANQTFALFNSQPPFLSMMIRDYYEKTKDKAWLADAYADLKTEYLFWQSRRTSPIGLTYYDTMPLTPQKIVADSKQFRDRTGLLVDAPDEIAARALVSAGESGWDMNPRMNSKTYQFAPADLNSLMYAMEDNLCYFAAELGNNEDAGVWSELREVRAELCRRYLKNADGIFMDYDFVEQNRNEIFSAACFYPLYCGMATKEEAKIARESLCRIEAEYGIATCEKTEVPGNYQWGYPNGWAPMQMIVVGGLLRYGYTEDAWRIMRKFVCLVEKCYQHSGHLWEKYNVVDGNVNVQDEYEMPTMLGWTFGVYVWFKDLLSKEDQTDI